MAPAGLSTPYFTLSSSGVCNLLPYVLPALAIPIAYHIIRSRMQADLLSPAPPGRLISAAVSGDDNLQHVTVLPATTTTTTRGGRPTIVLIHGFGCTSLEWANVIPRLREEGLTVFAYDRVVFARSIPLQDRSTATLVQELHTLLQRTHVLASNTAEEDAQSDSPTNTAGLVLVGHSYGGLIAQEYALQYPSSIAGLVLVDPAHERQFEEVPRDFTLSFKFVPAVFFVYRFLAPLGLTRLLDSLSLFNFPPLFLYPDRERLQARELYSLCSAWTAAAAELRGCFKSFDAWQARNREAWNALLRGNKGEQTRTWATCGPLPIRLVLAGKRCYSPSLNQEGITKAFVSLAESLLEAGGDSVDLVMASQSDHWVHLQQPEVVTQAILHVALGG